MTVFKSTRDSVKHVVRTYYTQKPTFSQNSSALYELAWSNVVNRADNLPDWKERIKQGRNASTWYSGSQCRVRSQDATARYRLDYPSLGNWQVTDMVGRPMSMQRDPLGLILPTASDIEIARSKAEIDFAKKFKRKTRHWQSGVFAGEIFELARMLASPAKSLRTGVDHLYRDLMENTRKAVRRSSGSGRPLTRRSKYLKDAIAGTYLEWTYGMKPAFSDLIASGVAFRAIASGRMFDMMRINGMGGHERLETTSEQFIIGGTVGHKPGMFQESRRVFHVDVSLRGAWKSELTGNMLPIPMQVGLTLGDIIPTAWELVPWSFLIDYFTNIGDVLDTLSMRNIQFIWLNETVRSWTSETIVPPTPFVNRLEPSLPPDGRATFTSTLKPTYIERKRVTRYPYSNKWTPSIRASMPGPKSQKWINIAALASMRAVPSHIGRLG